MVLWYIFRKITNTNCFLDIFVKQNAMKTKIKSLNEQELKELKALKNTEFQIITELGKLEVQKLMYLKEYDKLSMQLAEYQEVLEKEYGKIESVDFETGVIKQIVILFVK